jgi:hypothetical protein
LWCSRCVCCSDDELASSSKLLAYRSLLTSKQT